MDKKKLEELLNMLTENERKILLFFSRVNIDTAYESKIAEDMNLKLSEVSRGALWLSNKKLAERIEEKVKVIKSTPKAQKYVKELLPEEKLLSYLHSKKELELAQLMHKLHFEKQEGNIALGKLLRSGYIKIIRKDGSKVITLTEKGKEAKALQITEFLRKIIREREIPLEKKDKIIDELIKRGLLTVETKSIWKVKLTELGKEIIKLGISKHEIIDKITPEIITSKVWEKKKIRWYDVTSPVPKIWGGRKHPLRLIMEKIRQIFLEMGFREMRGPWVEISFWNMDAMWIPQDHPAREMQATFYVARPEKGIVRDKELVEIVKEVQETGGDTGSLGWRQLWDINLAMKNLLRTHTTAVTFRVLGYFLKNNLVKLPVKFFSIGRVFRNEAIDWKHLAEFHQVEGFVVGENLTLRSLMGYIKEFYSKMGIRKIRFKPTYNPYTEPSSEIFGWHEAAGKWVEIGNSGLFRPESLRPFGIKHNVIAWGLAVERLAAILYEIEDIRELIGPMTSIDWIRNYSLPVFEFERE